MLWSSFLQNPGQESSVQNTCSAQFFGKLQVERKLQVNKDSIMNALLDSFQRFWEHSFFETLLDKWV